MSDPGHDNWFPTTRHFHQFLALVLAVIAVAGVAWGVMAMLGWAV